MNKITVCWLSDWQWAIKGGSFPTTLLVGMTYGNNGAPSTYQYHLTDPKNVSGLAICGFIQCFDFPTEWAAKAAGIAKYKELFVSN